VTTTDSEQTNRDSQYELKSSLDQPRVNNGLDVYDYEIQQARKEARAQEKEEKQQKYLEHYYKHASHYHERHYRRVASIVEKEERESKKKPKILRAPRRNKEWVYKAQIQKQLRTLRPVAKSVTAAEQPTS